MSRDDPYGKRGPKATPKNRPALPSKATADVCAPTMVRCELCIGCGMVPPEVAALFAEMLGRIKEQA